MTVLEQVRPMTSWALAAIIGTMASDARRYSIMLPSDVADAARALGGEGGLSAFVLAAVRRELQRANIRELLEAAEEESGPISADDLQAASAELARALAELDARGHGRE